MPYFPNFDFDSIPTCQTEGSKSADLWDMAMGLRAMVQGEMPTGKAKCPVTVGEVLPQSSPVDHVARRAKQLKGNRFVSLARCEEQAWAELSYAASNEQVWIGSRALKGMPAVSSIQHTAASMDEDPDELGLFGTTQGTIIDQLAADEETAWKIEAIKAALSDREWSAVQMKSEGLSDQVIAENLDSTLATAKKVIRKARFKAKAALV